MNIVGLDSLVFGVETVEDAARYLEDYGLIPVDVSADGGRFEALDGTSIVIARQDDPSLPAAPSPMCRLRRTVMGVSDKETLDAIAAELGKDREARRLADGAVESIDDDGFVLRFQLTVRRSISLPGEISNAPGSAISRPVNSLAAPSPDTPIRPRTLSHVVYFVPDPEKSEAFYVERLGFRCVDRFIGVGPFLQPGGTLDHHTHFLIGVPHLTGVEHFTFHFGGPTDVIANGSRFVEKGYQSFWGPGRHIFGSNWFWYFNSPFGCHMEMDADMDLHDSTWRPRALPISSDNSQAFLLKSRKKWMPGPGGGGDDA